MTLMNRPIPIDIQFTSHGDVLIYSPPVDDLQVRYVSPLQLRHWLFAWHEPSFYGTELETAFIAGVNAIILPAEEVISFFAGDYSSKHIQCNWQPLASRMIEVCSILQPCLEQRAYSPLLSAAQSGVLQWKWELDLLEGDDPVRLELSGVDEEMHDGILGAFSAAVFQRYYGTQQLMNDLRREYPKLFDQQAPAAIDEQSWLIHIGWKPDTSSFRPVLQLLEPMMDDDEGQHESEGFLYPDKDSSDVWQLRLMLEDKLDPGHLVPVQLDANGTCTGKWPEEWASQVDQLSATWLERLQACLPESYFTEVINGLGTLKSELHDEQAWNFLTQDSQKLLDAGWQVLLPSWWEAASRNKPRVRAKIKSKAGSKAESLFGLNALVEFDWRIAIGDTDLTESEFAELVARNERLVRIRGQWVPLDPKLIAYIRKALGQADSSQGMSLQSVLQLHLLNQASEVGAMDDKSGAEAEADTEELIRIEVELNKHLNQLIKQLGGLSELPKPKLPDGLHAELRPYQYEGYSWLALLGRFGLGACLADDMGLGKTVQLIAYLLHLKEHDEAQGTSLIVCPTSVLGNWQKELNRFAPSLRIMLHYGAKRSSDEQFYSEAEQADVVLTSYTTAALDQELLKEHSWATICLDEAQNIKNAYTKQSAAVRSFPARHRIALTGTPIENRLSELWSIYDFISPGYLGSAGAFQQHFVQAIERDRDEERTAELQKLIQPFLLRRKKSDPHIQLDLPEKNEMKVYLNLTAEQGALYDQAVQQLMERMQKLEGIERKGAILAALTQLKQLCDHPILMTKEPIPDFAGVQGQDIANSLISRSSKLERLIEMVGELRDRGEQCLIFTQYIGMGQLLQRILDHQLQEPILYLNGSTPKAARDSMIEQFQTSEAGIFILSLKAGGVGLNLTAANHVFHFDRWWNPAVENQATDRAYRIGQTRDVQVHKFISLGTLEERIDEMLDNKQQLSDNVISNSEGWITELSTDELKDLFTLRREWVG